MIGISVMKGLNKNTMKNIFLAIQFVYCVRQTEKITRNREGNIFFWLHYLVKFLPPLLAKLNPSKTDPSKVMNKISIKQTTVWLR